MRGGDSHVDEMLSHRFAVMNVWMRWNGGNDTPLAVCSGDSLHPGDDDMQQSDLVYENRTGEIYSAIHNPCAPPPRSLSTAASKPLCRRLEPL